MMREEILNHSRPEWELYDLAADPLERRNLSGNADHWEIETELARTLLDYLGATADPILNGPVPAPTGYWEHFMAKSNGPGALPLPRTEEHWLTVRWPFGATEHFCSRSR